MEKMKGTKEEIENEDEKKMGGGGVWMKIEMKIK